MRLPYNSSNEYCLIFDCSIFSSSLLNIASISVISICSLVFMRFWKNSIGSSMLRTTFPLTPASKFSFVLRPPILKLSPTSASSTNIIVALSARSRFLILSISPPTLYLPGGNSPKNLPSCKTIAFVPEMIVMFLLKMPLMSLTSNLRAKSLGPLCQVLILPVSSLLSTNWLLAPQPGQNLYSGSIDLPQLLQTDSEKRGLPHCEQNLLLGSLLAPHLLHVIFSNIFYPPHFSFPPQKGHAIHPASTF